MTDDALIQAMAHAYDDAADPLQPFSADRLGLKAALAVCRPIIEAQERERWVKAMDSVLTAEQSYLFRDICAAAIRSDGR